jgi:hypothetical protein
MSRSSVHNKIGFKFLFKWTLSPSDGGWD